MDLSRLLDAREMHGGRISWTAIFLKAFALVAREVPDLRRAYIKLPWHHLYEWPKSVAMVTVEREWQGEKIVLTSRIRTPEQMLLVDISARLQTVRTSPLQTIPEFRRSLRLAVLPRVLRRLAFWFGLNSASRRVRHFGTFGVSVYSALGAESLHPIGPVTTMLNYGVIARDGTVDVRLIYDHRVMDGATIARALARMEEVLCEDIVEELNRTSVNSQRHLSIKRGW